MSARFARHATSTAMAVVALVILAPSAAAAPPTCTAPEPLTTVEDLPLLFFPGAYCEDPDLDELTFAVAESPQNGMLDDTNPFEFLYTPNTGYLGADGFSFTASDGTDETDPIPVAITVKVNEPPSCPATIEIDVEPGAASSYYPYDDCTDDGFIADFAIVDDPIHGTVAPFNEFEGFVYEPDAGYSGPDSFTFRASDGTLESDLATVEITVLQPNHAPHCVTPVHLRVPVGGALPLDYRTTCTDADGDSMFPELITGPSHGTLELNLPAVTYRPVAGYSGADLVRYRVRDDRGAESNIAVANITVGTATVSPVVKSDLAAPALDLARAGKQKLNAARKKGLRLVLTCGEAGTMSIEASVSKATARKLRIDRKAKGPVVVGRATKPVVMGENAITVKLSGKARKRLARARSVKLVLSVRVTDAAGNVGQDTLKLTLKR